MNFTKDVMIIEKGFKRVLDFFGWLTHKEVECNCHLDACKYTIIHEKTIESFIKTRHDYGHPIQVTSAYRCQLWNQVCGGVDGSYHTLGTAMDLVGSNLDLLERIAKKNFDVVIRYNEEGFLHCHNIV